MTRLTAATLGPFLVVVVQLALVLLVIRGFRLEEASGLLRLLPLVFGGFVVHALLPLPWRQPFFLVLSLAAIVLLFQANALWLVGLGLGLIGLCHLPVPFAARVGLVVAAGGLLVALRAEWIATDWAVLVLPILGAMFMFRLMIYLYDLRHERKPVSLWTRLNYFFLLPNVCFPLFPVIDYQTFQRTYYDQNANDIYQKGVLWVFRGAFHLILYRVVYHYFLPNPADIAGLGGVVQAMVATYLLYLRISGQFHLIVGLLCLFGFNLPETHHLYYLASSFNDYWRRINIYWKDFMMKLFYYPVFMRVKRFGMETGLVIATAVVFLGTWLLHSYQWFWLRGTFPLTLPDLLFWGILGALVIVNALKEAKRGRARSLKKTKAAFDLKKATVYAAKVLGMFILITVLWSLWSSGSVAEWTRQIGIALTAPLGEWGWFLLGCLGLIAVGVLVQWLQHRGIEVSVVGARPSFARAATATTLGSFALLLLTLNPIQQQFSDDGITFIASLQDQRFNQADAERLERGYYEGLLETERYTSALWTVQTERPRDWVPLEQSDAVRRVANELRIELIPSQVTIFKRMPMSTNTWGMRDRFYTQEKPSGVYRAALLGASYEMGAGVPDGTNFEALVEADLNAEYAGQGYMGYEILNFAVGGYSVHQQAVLLEEKVVDFAPDALFYTSHSGEVGRALQVFMNLVQDGISLPPFLQELQQRTGLTADMSIAEARRRLTPEVGEEILQWSYARIIETCREQGILPVWIFVPRTDGIRYGETEAYLRAFAEEAGFLTLSLDGAYGDVDRETIQLVPWDQHPNEYGHRLLADRLYSVLTAHADALRLGFTSGGITE